MSEGRPTTAGGVGGTEFDAIRRWVRLVPTGGAEVRLGPGDDVAVVDVAGPLAVSADALVEGTHFAPGADPADVGWKALAAALSDLAASRARPLGAVVSLTARRDDLGDWADALMGGLGECARAFACPVLGGDTTRIDGPAVIAVTVLGAGEDVLVRSGAHPGELLQLSGDVGWAAAGLAGVAGARAHEALHRPRPRLDLLAALAEATAGIDISDGFLADAAHLADASDVTLSIDAEAVVGPSLAAASSDARRFALSGGEDYELLVTAATPLPGFRVVGRVLPRGTHDLEWADGTPVPREARGWDHGAAP